MTTNKRTPRLLRCLSGALILTLAQAAAATEEAPKWSNQGLLYLLAPTLSGTQGVGELELDVDIGSSDVFDAIDSGFLGMYRGEGERWGGPPRRRVYGSKRRHRGYVRGLFR